MIDPRLTAVYIFGSVGRGDDDLDSDLDVLAVVRDGQGKVPDEVVLNLLPDDLRGREISISWYGQARLRQMFLNGELFAWHLSQDAVSVYEALPIIDDRSPPNPYREAVEDIRSFQEILDTIPSALQAAPENAVYELGLVYVCTRNIAMAASSSLCARPDFSRLSPYRLTGVPPCPMDLATYTVAMKCRMVGQRGGDTPSVDAPQVIMLHESLMAWTEEVVHAVEGVGK